MIRTFHPVGQGAFYSEDFEDLKIIYDCGGSTKPIIENEIRNSFEKDTMIDALFISHLHADHVNGVEYLLTHCIVKKIFLPLLTEQTKIQLLIHNSTYNNENSFIAKLIKNPESAVKIFSDSTTIINVAFDEGGDDKNEVEGRLIDFDEIQKINKIENRIVLPTNSKITSSKIDDWVFIPFNLDYVKKSQDLKNELNNNSITISTIDEFENAWKNKATKLQIINIYKKIVKDHNTHSLVLYSGEEKDSKNIIKFGYYSNSCCYIMKHLPGKVGCLYFGDYNASVMRNWSLLKSYFINYLNLIGCVQIPHHGSRHNYNTEIIKSFNPHFSIISAGFKNGYSHPHMSTIKDILKGKGNPILVTDLPSSEFKMLIFRK